MKTFDLLRKNGTKIENEYNFTNGKNLGIIFSGFAYTYKNPLLYYSRNILFDHNIDYFGIDYKYYDDTFFEKMNEQEQNIYFEEDKDIIINKIIEINNNYNKLILIGKSIGTCIIKKCINNKILRDKAIIILITPAVEWEQIIDEIKNINNPILVIGSLKDKHYCVKNLGEIYNRNNIDIYEIKEGDHSLEINDAIKDIEQLKNIMGKINTIIEINMRIFAPKL
ncbi:MAG: hypothetical protein LBQ46_03675 [Treponema sp.]|jgi:hypothetical protein|nr:hypothetical protein [Treponema sp.]